MVEGCRQARKLFRLFKSIDEYQAIVQIIFHQNEDLPNLMRILTKLCYFFYWIFDNISVASQVKLFSFNYEKYMKIAYACKLIGLLISIATFVYEMWIGKEDSKHKKKHRRTKILELIRSIADAFPTAKDSGLAEKVLRVEISEYLAGFGGLVAACISTFLEYTQRSDK